MNWINPKTNWQAGDGVMAGDFNRIENNIEYLNWQAVYGVFDITGYLIYNDYSWGGNNNAAPPKTIASKIISIPQGQKLILTHLYLRYANQTNSMSSWLPELRVYSGAGSLPNLTRAASQNLEVWERDVAPVLFANTTPTAVEVRVVLFVNSVGGGNYDTDGFARVVIVDA